MSIILISYYIAFTKNQYMLIGMVGAPRTMALKNLAKQSLCMDLNNASIFHVLSHNNLQDTQHQLQYYATPWWWLRNILLCHIDPQQRLSHALNATTSWVIAQIYRLLYVICYMLFLQSASVSVSRHQVVKVASGQISSHLSRKVNRGLRLS